jgi:hypothetical protein
MRKLLVCFFIVACSLEASGQSYFHYKEQYNLRMSDGAKVIINSIAQLIKNGPTPLKCTRKGFTPLPYVKKEVSPFFFHYLQYDPKQPNISMVTYFDENGSTDPDGDSTRNMFGLIVMDTSSADDSFLVNDLICADPASMQRYRGSNFGFNNLRFRLIKETDLLNAMQPFPNNCEDTNSRESAFLQRLFASTEAIRSVDIFKDIDSSAGIIDAGLNIPYNDPGQWGMFDNYQNMYGIVLTLKEKSSGANCRYYLVSNSEGSDFVMKQIATDTGTNNPVAQRYDWAISSGGKAVLAAIEKMILTKSGNYHKNICGAMPISYIDPTWYEPDCEPVNYNFQIDWRGIKANETSDTNNFFLNLFAVANAPCMLPYLHLPCNYTCLLTDAYSNQVWNLRFVDASLVDAFLAQSKDSLLYAEGNVYALTQRLPAIDLLSDILKDPKKISFSLVPMRDRGATVKNYYNYPYNALGIKMTYVDTKNTQRSCYLMSDYDGSSTLLWKEPTIIGSGVDTTSVPVTNERGAKTKE